MWWVLSAVLLTGCTGWLGRSIVPYFQSHGYDCDVLSRKPGTNLTGDARSLVFPRKYDYIVHGAMDGAQNIIDQAGDAKVLFLSSGAVYARKTPYADLKRRDEAIMAGRATIARLFTFIGPNMPEWYAAGEFLRCLRDGRTIYLNGDGRTVRSYLHVDDLPQILDELLHSDETATVDVGSSERVTILDLALRIAQYGGLNVSTSDTLINPVDSYVPAPGAFGGYASDLEDAIARSIWAPLPRNPA